MAEVEGHAPSVVTLKEPRLGLTSVVTSKVTGAGCVVDARDLATRATTTRATRLYIQPWQHIQDIEEETLCVHADRSLVDPNEEHARRQAAAGWPCGQPSSSGI